MKVTEKIIIGRLNLKPGRGRSIERLQMLALKSLRREQKAVDFSMLNRCESIRYILGTYKY